MPARFTSSPVTIAAATALVSIATFGCRAVSPDGPRPVGSRIVAPTPAPQDPLETIARYEDARTDGEGLLQTLLQKGSAKTRERAATALGRLDASVFGAAVTDGLEAALGDEASPVRAAAAFALGQRGDASAAIALLAHWRDPDPLVRARIVQAASRLDDARLRAKILGSLDDADASVRSEAVLAPSRFPANAIDEVAVDEALVAFLSRDGTGPGPFPDAEARWRGLFALARRKSERGRALFVARATSSDVRERIHAVQGLGAIASGDATRQVLERSLNDPDWRVACEAATALGKHPALESFGSIAAATAHPSAHVRRCAFEALGHFRDDSGPGSLERLQAMSRPVLEHARVDASPNVRAAAIEAGAALFGAEAAPNLWLAAKEKDPIVRAGAAAAAAHLPPRIAVALLDELSRDHDLRVAGIATEGLGRHDTADARARLTELLRSDDNGLRLAAVTGLSEMATGADVPELQACLESSRGEIAAEVAALVMDTAVKIGGDGGLALLRLGLAHSDPYVRKHARELAAKAYPSVAFPPARGSLARLAAVPLPKKELPTSAATPRVEVRTSRGKLVFELFPDEAPGHVFNFLALIERRHYDGLTFHRVVPDFVIQGGDHRGDGNGGVTWRGEPLRAEFTPRPFVRGSLGMPRNADPDSGGSQFFVTHRETPHLDGRYTVFGELRQGFEVLDAIEVGDTIQSVELLDAK